MLGERGEDHTWVSPGVQGSRRCRGADEGAQAGCGVRRREVGDSQRGRVCRKQRTTSREEPKARNADLEKPPGFIGLRKAGLIGTYPKEEKV